MNKRKFLKTGLLGAIVGLFTPAIISKEDKDINYSDFIKNEVQAKEVIKMKGSRYLVTANGFLTEDLRIVYDKLVVISKDKHIEFLIIPNSPTDSCEFPYELLRKL